MSRIGLAMLLALGLAGEAQADAGKALRQALAAQDRGETEGAIELYSRALEEEDRLSPDQRVLARNNRAVALRTSGQLERAIEDYESALRLRPWDRDLLFNRALAFKQAGQHARAKTELEQLVASDPEDAQARYQLGRSLQAMGAFEPAIEVFDDLSRRAKAFAPALAARGEALAALKRHEDAVAAFDEALKLSPDHPDYLRGRGFSRSGLGFHELAIADYKAALEQAPDDARSYRGSADAHRRLGRHDQALADYGRAIDLAPDDFLARYGQGLSLKAEGRYSAALDAFGAAVQIEPRFGLGYKQRGAMRFYLGHFEAAARDLRRAIGIRGARPYLVLWLYLARERAGLDGRAELEAYAQSLEPDAWPAPIVSLFLGETMPEALLASFTDVDHRRRRELECEAYFYIGQVQLLQGKLSEAAVSFRRSVEQGITTFMEHQGAQVELRKLAAHLPTARDGSGLDTAAVGLPGAREQISQRLP